jgi:TonB-dependent receptor
MSTGGEWNFGERWLRADATYSHTNKDDPNRDEWIFESDDSIEGDYLIGSRRYSIMPNGLGLDPFDATEFEVNGFEPESRNAEEDLFQIRLDYRFPIGWGIGSDFQIGVKYLDRDKVNNIDGRIWEEDGSSLTLDQVLGRNIPSIFDGSYPYGPTVSAGLANAYFLANPGEFSEDEEGTAVATLGGDYRVTEEIIAGYAMARLRFGDWTIIPGVRVESTTGEFSAKAFDASASPSLDMAYNVFGSNDYTDVFGSLNIRYDVGENVVLRGAITQSLGRPNYETIAPYVIIEDGDEVSAGNPNLDPLYSTNFDLAAEYYIGEGGILSVALFHKEIDNPIYETGFDVLAGTVVNGVTLAVDSEVETFANARDATLTGIEFNAQLELTFLPAPLDGLSVGASVTFVDSEANGVPNRTDAVPLLGQSDIVGAANLSYERNRWSGRVAYTYRSEYLLEVSQDGPEFDIYADDLHQWDARVAFAMNPNATLFLEGSNLNDASFRTYAGFRNRMGEEERYGWTARTGLQVSF